MKADSKINRYRVASLVIHTSTLVLLGVLLRHISLFHTTEASRSRRVMQRLVLSLPGSVEAGSPKSVAMKTRTHTDLVSERLPKPSHPGRLSQASQTGEGVAGKSAWGVGEITIAFPKFFPHPAPDLSTMRHGSEGDVILDARIDEQGKISHLTLVAGIDAAINHDVIQTVESWTFTPAMKDGQPVSSEQELHFHFKSVG